MKTIKTFTAAALVALSMGAASTAALADSPRSHVRENSVERRLDTLDDRIDRGVRTRELNRNEASRLRNELRDIEKLSNKFERSGRGYDRQEMNILTSRIDRLSQKVAYNNHDRQTRRF
ncbi:hypothetical protein [Asticcacaulis endophyticus]|uniref:Uncharacterized protein n=1 Tax=Asticcacaulis endophyticus TaxID=1395890 RepID=A0A918PWP2_9CAUL|nr:hypothetical protein [Asticcacaulis endophyticus]GGZ25556.1 hypothetical protein GCM10011273_08680 [Asticcacaulis endophyticus]